MTHKPISLTITTVVLSLVSFWGGQRLYSQRGASNAPVAAFTAHITQRNIPPPGVTTGAIRITEMIYARRNDRSFVHKVISVASDGTDATVTEIVDTVSKAFTLLEPTTKSKTTYLYTPEKLLRFLNAMESENCGSENAVVTGAPIKVDPIVKTIFRLQ
jgi:hypothetical protein